jgi:hypothetical protein
VGSRRLRPLRPTAVLVALLGLAACTAGVPQTGEVVSVSPVTTAAPQPDADTPSGQGGPPSGQSEVEVATGYMNAMNTGDVMKIQRWVMPESQDLVARWPRPTTTVKVYSIFEPGPPSVRGDGRRVVPVKVKLVGQLRNGRDWYPASGDDVLTLELASDGPDLRVANPGGSIWMRDLNFSRLYASAELYLVPDLAHPSPQLAPVPIFVRRDADGNPEVPEPGVRQALELLLAGPRGRYANLQSAIPKGTQLNGIRYANGVATVDLTAEFAKAAGSGALRVGQVVWTVNRLLPTASVRILVEGRPARTVGDDQFNTMRYWRRRDVPLAAMWPQRSRERLDDSVLFVRRGEIYKVTPESGQSPELQAFTARGAKSAPTWSPDGRSMAFLAGTGTDRRLWVRQPAGQAFQVEGVSGRLSPPSWSPDSKRLYLIQKTEAGPRLLEVNRSTLNVRRLDLPPMPLGLQASSIVVSPDGAFVLAVGDRPGRKLEDAEPVPGGQLFLGQFGLNGVTGWSERTIAPGLGRIFSPVWVDPVTVAFIAETTNKDDPGKLWTMRSDGWDPMAVLNETNVPVGDIGNHLTVDPTGQSFVVPARSSNGISLWMINRQEKRADNLTFPGPNTFDSDPSFASR